MDAFGPKVIVAPVSDEGGVVSCTHPDLPEVWGEGPDEDSARRALAEAMIRATTGAAWDKSLGDLIYVGYDGNGDLDEIFAERTMHLEYIDQSTCLLVIGTGGFFIEARPDGTLNIELRSSNSEKIAFGPTYDRAAGRKRPAPRFRTHRDNT
jgi:hypothetical protein